MLDFTSSLYLGMQHPAWTLSDWTALTLGKPAALESPPGAEELESGLAALTGCEAALLATSTLHAFFDLFAALAGPRTTVLIDHSAYPISGWAVRRAGAHTRVRFFPPCDFEALHWLLRRSSGFRPLVVTDGVAPISGVPAPLAAYSKLAAMYGGFVVVDDTQALGILGSSPGGCPPYGRGGGGSLQHAGIRSNEVIIVSSLAKALGVPVAMIGGSRSIVDRLRSSGLMRKHASPPSVAVISAGIQALEANRRDGDRLRNKLARSVARFRKGLIRTGIAANGTLFPVQPLHLHRGQAFPVYGMLLRQGIRAVLQRNAAGSAQISFLLTARHSSEDIDEVLAALAHAVRTKARITGVDRYDSKS